MTVATEKRLLREISVLKRDIAELKTVILTQTKDDEGEYREEFVREVLRAAKRRPTKIYRKGAFTRL